MDETGLVLSSCAAVFPQYFVVLLKTISKYYWNVQVSLFQFPPQDFKILEPLSARIVVI